MSLPWYLLGLIIIVDTNTSSWNVIIIILFILIILIDSSKYISLELLTELGIELISKFHTKLLLKFIFYKSVLLFYEIGSSQVKVLDVLINIGFRLIKLIKLFKKTTYFRIGAAGLHIIENNLFLISFLLFSIVVHHF